MRSWADIGHRNYCLRSDGRAYSHSDVTINNLNQPLKFKAGNILHFVYNRKRGKLSISKDHKSFEMNI